jgi:hypothetical protein
MSTVDFIALRHKVLFELSSTFPPLPINGGDVTALAPGLQQILHRVGIQVYLNERPAIQTDRQYMCGGDSTIIWDGIAMYPDFGEMSPEFWAVHELAHYLVCRYFEPSRLKKPNYGLGHLGGCNGVCPLKAVSNAQRDLEESMAIVVEACINYVSCRDGLFPHRYSEANDHGGAEEVELSAYERVVSSGLITIDAAGEPQLAFLATDFMDSF